ncbi:pyridoxal phosphate-dependent aminotransferase [Endozoicomonas gorgoniicola]|uniref:Aminotransferase n=1 Tax=Endozoicomonas gorgoniicola TaxID=1234144 RepID=A0ABT3N313_9GAMM|nr:pyridoxal phosphate-dependent aminotransferase [Endozoicomonas gorgoniicola]MCW7556016.1 pyridoxal phosphate-dependent aminotransferase [Endozoicomonas gorgoniicola]
MAIANYSIQEWLFDKAHGKFKYDLAESGVQFQHVRDLQINYDWCLDYSVDRGGENLRNCIKAMYSSYGELYSLVTHGAQEALYLFYNSLLNKDDHVICTLPGWQQAWEVPKKIGCKVTLLEWKPGYGFPVDKLVESINKKTKLLIINSPCNPTGVTLTAQELSQLISICQSKGIWIINDEEYLVDFKDSVVNKYNKSVSVSSLSKIYGLPALRLGWAVSRNQSIIEEMVNYKRYTSVSNSLLLENTAIHVLQEKNKHIERFKNYIDSARPILDNFAKLADEYLTLVEPENTPYAWFNTKEKVDSSLLALELLNQHHLLIMPAELFGYKNGIRLTYARDLTYLTNSLNMILETLNILNSSHKCITHDFSCIYSS